MMHENGKSDSIVVPEKSLNNAGRPATRASRRAGRQMSAKCAELAGWIRTGAGTIHEHLLAFGGNFRRFCRARP